MPDLAGKTVVITGANSGIGLEAARAFAAHGAHVVFAVRTESKGQAAAATISGTTEVRQVDLADVASARGFAADWSGDILALINNAGVLVPPFGLTGIRRVTHKAHALDTSSLEPTKDFS
jgi:NAD(P)-dependent dehydrogenase (short-subunit alcohol dehydrogenase family)